MESIYKAIKQKRKERRMTQAELGKQVDACYVSICNLEKGRNVSTHLLRDVCKYLNIEICVKDKNNE